MSKTWVSKLFFILLIFTLGLGIFLRFWKINQIPSALYWDELDVGYQAYSFLKTGKDYYGNNFPIYFHSFADFRTPLYIYLTAPFIHLFGLTALAVRLPALLFGLISIFLIYLVTLELTKNKIAGIVSSIVLTFNPWIFHYSRISFELTCMLMFFLLGIYSFLRSLKSAKWLILSALGFSLSIWAYSIAKLFVPLFLIGLLVIFKKEILKIPKKHLLISTTCLVLLTFPIFFSNFFNKGGMRFSEVSIFTDPTIGKEIDTNRQKQNEISGNSKEFGQSSTLINKLVYNKYLTYADEFSKNYLRSISFEFLFLEGDKNLRHSPNGIGQFYKIEFLTLFLGLVFIIVNWSKFKKNYLVLIFWAILAPIPSALTREGGNHASRLFFLLPTICIFISLGIALVLQETYKKMATVILSVYLILYIYQNFIFLNNYFTSYAWDSAKDFQYGFQEASQRANFFKDSYTNIFLDDNDGSLLMAYLFTTKYDPASFQKIAPTIRTELYPKAQTDKVGNLYFMVPASRDWLNILVTQKLPGKNLLIISASQAKEQDPKKLQGELGFRGKLIETIYYPSKLPAFYVIEAQI